MKLCTVKVAWVQTLAEMKALAGDHVKRRGTDSGRRARAPARPPAAASLRANCVNVQCDV